MYLTTTNPSWVSVDPPIISGEMHACGWAYTSGGALFNRTTYWRVGASKPQGVPSRTWMLASQGSLYLPATMSCMKV